ncbi:MAG: ferritin-like domain-containing protein [Solirubrobacteraceae bacterium]
MLRQMLTRARFLRLGTTVALGTLAAPAGARAALPTPTPQGDDEGFLQFGALTERTALAFYRRALKTRGLTSGERRRLRAVAAEKVVHVQRLTAALGADAPSVLDYAVALPASAFVTRAGTLKLGRRLESLLCGVYVGAVAFTADPASRLLLGRLLTSDAQHLALVRDLAGLAPGGGLPDPIDLKTAGAQLDTYLKANGYPTL